MKQLIFLFLISLLLVSLFNVLKTEQSEFRLSQDELVSFTDSIRQVATEEVIIEFTQKYVQPGWIDLLNSTITARVTGRVVIGYESFDIYHIDNNERIVDVVTSPKSILAVEHNIDYSGVDTGLFNSLTRESLNEFEKQLVDKIKNHPKVEKALKTKNTDFFNHITSFKNYKISWNYEQPY
jgi:hypothetical protein